MLALTFRLATPADADEISALYLESRKTFLPYAPLAHSDEDVHHWLREVLLPECETHLALLDGQIAGFLALKRSAACGWVEQLYLLPAATGQGIGTQLLAIAKNRLGAPLRLYTFQPNHGARRFYERHGFKAIEFGDGSGNEERCPDVLYEWQGQA